MPDGLQELNLKKESYDKDSQALIDSLMFAGKELELLNSMKATEGWKVLEAKLRLEIENRITFLIKDDLVMKTLLALLNTTDTKTLEKNLKEEVSKLIP